MPRQSTWTVGAVFIPTSNLPKEILDITRNLAVVGFQGKMTAVHKPYYGIRQVALEGLGSLRNEGRVILPPNGQKARPVLPEITLEFRIEAHIVLIIENEVILHLGTLRQLDIGIIQHISIRADASFRHAEAVLPFDGFQRNGS